MQRNDCAVSLGRILALFSSRPEEAEAYISAIQEACGWMTGYRFDEVCKQLLAGMSAGRRPVPSQFLKLYHDLGKSLGWDANDAVTRGACPACGGPGMVYVWLRNLEDGRVDQFAKPCPSCRRDHPLANAPTRKGWIEVNHEAYLISQASTMGPDGAQFAIGIIDHSSTPAEMPREVMVALVESAGKSTDQTRYGDADRTVLDRLGVTGKVPDPEIPDWGSPLHGLIVTPDQDAQ